jgi:hypothetical protein
MLLARNIFLPASIWQLAYCMRGMVKVSGMAKYLSAIDSFMAIVRAEGGS